LEGLQKRNLEGARGGGTLFFGGCAGVGDGLLGVAE
jgi:hypothetical protein